MPTIGVTSADYPAGGLAGQMLTKRSAQDFDMAWSTPPQPYGINLISGLWYDPRVVPQSSTSVNSVTANTVWYLPLYLPRAVTTSQVGISTTSTAAGNINIGFNTMNMASTTLAPQTLIGYQTISAAASGSLTGNISVNLPAGWCYIAVGFSVAISVTCCAPDAFPSPYGVGSVSSGGTDIPYWNHWISGVSTPATNPASSISSQRASGFAPLPFFKVA